MTKYHALFLAAAVCGAVFAAAAAADTVVTNASIVVTATAISKYRVEQLGSAGILFAAEASPQVVDVLTEDFIRDRNPTDLDNLLSFQPGIYTGGKTLLSRTAGQYTMRGISGSQVLLNGVVPMTAGMGTFMDASLLERVELPKGPVGAFYGGQGSALGPYGAGGAIVLFQKRAQAGVEFANAEFRASFADGGAQRYRLVGDLNDSVMYGSVWMRVPFGVDFNKAFWMGEGARLGQAVMVAPSFVWEGDGVRAGWDWSVNYSDRQGYQGISIFQGKPRAPYAWDTNVSPDDMRAEYLGVTHLGWAEWDVTDALTLRAGAGMALNFMDYDQVGPSSGIPSSDAPYEASTGDTEAYSYNTYLHAVRKFENGAVKHTFVAGADWTRQEREGVSAWQSVAAPRYLDREKIKPAGSSVDKFGLFLNDGIEYRDFRAVLGARYDHYKGNKGNGADTFSPRAGVSYLVTPRVIPFANVMLSSAPNFGHAGEDGKELTGTWTATQFETGLRVAPAGDLWLGASVFQIGQRNTPLSTTGSPNGPFVSDGSTASRGVEFSATGNIRRNWSLHASWAFIDFEDKNSNQKYDRFPPHAASLFTTYQPGHTPLAGTVLGFGYRYRDGFDQTMRGMYQGADYRINAYHVFDASVETPLPKSWGMGDASFSFAVKNIFDERFIESARNMQCFPGDPRTFEIAVRMKF